MKIKLKELSKLLKFDLKKKYNNITIKGISIDTRTIKKDDLFIALHGKVFNGHEFIEEALEKGAKIIIGSENFKKNIDCQYFKVKNTLIAYQKIANFYRKKQNYKVIAITGSNGKTTTKDMIYSVLSKKYKVIKTFNNNNNEIGVPLTILSAKSNTEILILEFGMRGLREIKKLTDIADPDIGIITNIGVSHIGRLGSEKNIFKAKKELFDNIKKTGIILVNGEDKYYKELIKNFNGEKHIFGFSNNSSIRAFNLKFLKNKSFFKILRENKEYKVEFSFIGNHFVLNALIALEIGCIFGIPLKKGIKYLNNINITKGRLDTIKKNEYILLDGSYNSNPESVKASLEILKNYDGKRKIAVLGDMLELGIFKKKYHEYIGEIIFKFKIDFLITVGKTSIYIAKKALSLGMKKNNIYSVHNNKEAIKYIRNIIQKNDIILVKGSNSINMKEIVDEFKGDK